MTVSSKEIQIVEASPERWADFEQLMGPDKGGSGGCWCMLWRLRKKDFESLSRTDRRDEMRGHFSADNPPGLLAYHDDAPIGWCSIAPREELPRLESSRILKPVDDQPVWSVTCFYIASKWRRKGVSLRLLEAACGFVKRRGGTVLEGYPIEPDRENYPAVYAWIGLASTYKRAGFTETARRSPTRPIMRKCL
ncbi:MAG: GNAT family N-acetyltransferase [Rhodobacteraceae bacterium]|nr:GNAT family N-acetyltransferase [Paracoccaceae bacterium]